MHDKYHAHEALDRCSLAVDFIADNLVGHPFVVDHPQIASALDAALSDLHRIYQDIGAVSSSAAAAAASKDVVTPVVAPPVVEVSPPGGRSSQYDTGSGTTPGMWEMVNDALVGEVLPLTITEVVNALAGGTASVHYDVPRVGR